MPTIIDIGVASPSAQGQAMINTATEFTIAHAGSFGLANIQITNVSSAQPSTMGTNTAEIRSAIF